MKFNIAMAQVAECPEEQKNLERAEDMIRCAKAQNAVMVVFPECFMRVFPHGTSSRIIIGSAQSLDGPFVTAMQALAAKYGMWLVFGMREKIPGDTDRTKNTAVVLDDVGAFRTSYSKTHLFDGPGYQESRHVAQGEKLFTPIDTPFGKMGLFVCYELRFPEVARLQTLQGADFIVMPTAWIRGENKGYQLHTLLRARAMENQVWLVCCDQCGEVSMGESTLVSPTGHEIVTAGEEEELLIGEIDTGLTEQARSLLPLSPARRTDLYELKQITR